MVSSTKVSEGCERYSVSVDVSDTRERGREETVKSGI